jgi:hypothetical protein
VGVGDVPERIVEVLSSHGSPFPYLYRGAVVIQSEREQMHGVTVAY